MNLIARYLKTNSFILSLVETLKSGKINFLEVNLWRKCRRRAHHFYLVVHLLPSYPSSPLH
eukprot:UN21458